jgi:hypothetical protein
MVTGGRGFASKRREMPWEVIIGRALAFCVHPVAAWHSTTRVGRAFVVFAYAAGGFLTTLTALIVLE